MKLGDKGIALGQFLTVVIAVIGLIFLIGFGAKLFGSVFSGEDEKAQNIIENIKGKIDNLKEEETGRFNIRGLDGWFLAGWGKNELNRLNNNEIVERPEKCFLKSCICICKGIPEDPEIPRPTIENNCQEKGFCRYFEQEKIKIRGRDRAEIYVSDGGVGSFPAMGRTAIKSFETPYIPLKSNLIEIEISKKTDLIEAMSK